MLSVERAGVDTWKPAWYIEDGSRADRALNALATVRSTGGLRLLPDAIEGHRIGYYPYLGLAIAEGHPDPTGLADPAGLPQALCDLELSLWDHGIPVEPDRTRSVWGGVLRPQTADRLPGFAGVGRCDATADLRFDDAGTGMATLAGIAAVGMPRMKVQTWRHSAGHLETVSFHGHSGGRIVARWYDKGVEATSAPRGTLIRPEDQRRYGSQTRRGVDELTNSYVHEKFAQRFRPLWQATEGVTVASIPVIVERVGELIEDGAITVAQGEQLVGYAQLQAAGVDGWSSSTGRRRRRLARDCGLVLADESQGEIRVNLSEVMEQLMDAGVWGCDQ